MNTELWASLSLSFIFSIPPAPFPIAGGSFDGDATDEYCLARMGCYMP